MIPFAGCFQPKHRQPREGDLVFVGLPEDSRSSFARGAAAAPRRLREAYDGRCFNSSSESGVDLAGRVLDLSDWPARSDWKETRQFYRGGAASLWARGAVPFFVGGDHAVTIPLGEALAELKRPVHVIQVDAHPDLYPEFGGDRDSHACTASRLLEQDHVASLTQIGVRAFDSLQRRQAEDWGDRLKIIEAGASGAESSTSLPYPQWIPEDALVYLTLDIDALDPAFAPGVSHPVPGGLNSRQMLDWLGRFPWRLAGMDLVEVNPSRDLNDLTSITAARLLHQAMASQAERAPIR
ncbi:MAG TPA: arginase family protein [Acidobacteriota bacterium]|nr:arginase family protein [Acidobacteriota bacterium]